MERTKTIIEGMEFEPKIRHFESHKTTHALDQAATVMDKLNA
jgi:hypothetical protein